MLGQKQQLSDEVIDARGEKTTMSLPSGRAAFMERVQMLMGQETPRVETVAKTTVAHSDPVQALREDVISQWGARLDLLQLHHDGSDKTILVVVNSQDPQMQAGLHQSLSKNLPGAKLQILDRATYDSIQRMVDAGMLNLKSAAEVLYRSPTLDKVQENLQVQRLHKARALLTHANRRHEMAQVLAKGGFPVEALPALRDALESGMQSLAQLNDDNNLMPVPLSMASIQTKLVDTGKIPDTAASLWGQLGESSNETDQHHAQLLLAKGNALMMHIGESINKAALQ